MHGKCIMHGYIYPFIMNLNLILVILLLNKHLSTLTYVALLRAGVGMRRPRLAGEPARSQEVAGQGGGETATRESYSYLPIIDIYLHLIHIVITTQTINLFCNRYQ